jgi:ATPase subunit of ABC transporter with duplicated ATPase domains
MITIDGISLRLGGHLVLNGASASLPPKAHIGLVGRNGAGKSSLLKLIAGLYEADGGSIEAPSGTRIGYLAQEAPGGKATPFETVLAADEERARLLAEAEQKHDPHRIGEIHERLNTIDAHAAPARAARILAGLGFPEAAQHRPLDSFSGGWRMRVALAALLFSAPDLLLLDEPSNHLDLEAALWLESFLKAYRGNLIVVSHERDFLNNVADYVLHLERGGLTLYRATTTPSRGSGPSARRRPRRCAASRRPRPRSCKPMWIAGDTRRIPRVRRKAGSRRWRRCSRSARRRRTLRWCSIFPIPRSCGRRSWCLTGCRLAMRPARRYCRN